ncbi:hypothetical protein BH23ACT9_BH23ACT9_10890 [soil metagenome]
MRGCRQAGRLIVCDVVWAELRAAFPDTPSVVAACHRLGVDFVPGDQAAASLAGAADLSIGRWASPPHDCRLPRRRARTRPRRSPVDARSRVPPPVLRRLNDPGSVTLAVERAESAWSRLMRPMSWRRCRPREALYPLLRAMSRTPGGAVGDSSVAMADRIALLCNTERGLSGRRGRVHRCAAPARPRRRASPRSRSRCAPTPRQMVPGAHGSVRTRCRPPSTPDSHRRRTVLL